MKRDTPQPLTQTHRLEVWATAFGIVAAAVFVGATSVLVQLEVANSTANTVVPQGEAGLWSPLGQKD